MKDKDAQLMMEALRVKEADYVPPHDEDKLKRAKQRGYDDDTGPVSRVGDEVTGDPSTYQVGQILRSSQTGDHLDGMIVDISEEDGELTFALMEIGEEGWTVRASEIKPGPGDLQRQPNNF